MNHFILWSLYDFPKQNELQYGILILQVLIDLFFYASPPYSHYPSLRKIRGHKLIGTKDFQRKDTLLFLIILIINEIKNISIKIYYNIDETIIIMSSSKTTEIF